MSSDVLNVLLYLATCSSQGFLRVRFGVGVASAFPRQRLVVPDRIWRRSYMKGVEGQLSSAPHRAAPRRALRCLI